MTDWNDLSARGGRVGHDLVGWVMWDERAKAGLGELGFPNTGVWIVAWRLAGLGNTPHPVAAAMTYSIHPDFIEAIRGTIDAVTTNDAVLGVLDDAIVPGLESIVPGLAADLGELADELWAGVDAMFHGMRPFFSAFRARPRPADRDPACPPGTPSTASVSCAATTTGRCSQAKGSTTSRRACSTRRWSMSTSTAVRSGSPAAEAATISRSQLRGPVSKPRARGRRAAE